MLSSYYIDNETVRGVDHYQMLDTYVQSGAQQLAQNAVFRLHEAAHISHKAILFYEMCSGIHGLEDMVHSMACNITVA